MPSESARGPRSRRVFLTGATGFIGSYLVPELIKAGHQVVGLTRSSAGAEALTRAGAEVFRGDANDLNRLRTATEAADALIAKGRRVMVMRLPQVHDTRRQGRNSWHIQIARQHGRVAYVGEGNSRVAAVHVTDAVLLYRLALERGQAVARYHAVGEQGVALRDIAAVIGAGLKLPVRSITAEEAPEYFGWMAHLATIDLAASSALTRQQLGWNPPGRPC